MNMILEHAYGELLEACLAVNLAYLALERFRYRDAIVEIIRKAKSYMNGMPPEYRTDKAWEDLAEITDEDGPAKKHFFLRFFYRKIFTYFIDRILITATVVIAFMVLALRAVAPTLFTASMQVTWWEWALTILFLFITAMTAYLVFIGRRCVRKVADVVMENTTHFAKIFKDKNKESADKMLEFVEEIRKNHRGL
jgi:hypothetical protein